MLYNSMQILKRLLGGENARDPTLAGSLPAAPPPPLPYSTLRGVAFFLSSGGKEREPEFATSDLNLKTRRAVGRAEKKRAFLRAKDDPNRRGDGNNPCDYVTEGSLS